MKKCPYCAEKIQNEALVCRFCGKELPKTETPAPTDRSRPDLRKFLFQALAVMGILLLATGAFFLFRQKPAASELPTAAVLPTATQSRPLLYALNFENEAAFFGWHVGGPGTDYLWLKNTKDGKYLFEFPSGFLESQDFDFGDVQIGMDVEFLVKTRVEVGLACRMQPGASGRYSFNIANDGRWSIRNGESILAEGWSDQIKPDKNRLAARCIGDQLTLLVNDVELGSARDGAFVSGSLNFGYAADSAGAGAFDNLTVEDWGAGKPPEAESTSAQSAALEPATPTLAPVATAHPTLRPTVIPESELTLYQTKFDENDPSLADWKTFAYSMNERDFVTAGYEAKLVNGVYRMRALDPIAGVNLRIFSIYDQDLVTADVDISVQLKNGHMGLVCRSSEAGWYQFMVEPEGIWSIRLAKPDENGQFHFYTISSGLRWGRETLRAECKGDRLTFYIDDEKMASLRDPTFPTGKVGLLGWNFPISGEIGIGMQAGDIGMVDNFTVQRAQWNETGLPGPAPTPGAEGTIYSTDFAKLDDLNPYWAKVDTGVQGIPGSPVLVGGPGQPAPHTYLYLNDFDPGPDVEITADVRGELNFPRGLICRYSEDGWYETFFMKDSPEYRRVALARMERDEQGKLMPVILDTYYPSTPAAQVNLTLTCAENQISVKANGERVLFAEDNTWRTGRYGFLITDNPPGNFRSNTLLNYTVRPAQVVQPGEVVFQPNLDTPEKILQFLRIGPGTKNIEIQDGAVIVSPTNGLNISSIEYLPKDTVTTIEVEFLNSEGFIGWGCRTGTNPPAFQLRPDGGWAIFADGQMKANGTFDHMLPGKNQIQMRCMSSELTLIVNGETISSVEDPHFDERTGQISISALDGLGYALHSVKMTAFQGLNLKPLPPLLNQVSLPPAYQPDETIFAWDMQNFLLGCGSGWSGRDPNPCLWAKNLRKQDWERSWQGELVWVKGYEDLLAIFTYQPDLYDLPIEISAETTLTSKGGGVALFCRATQNGRYEFYLQPDGTWFIRRDVNVEYGLPKAKHLTTLANGKVENFSPEKAQLSATCNGPKLIFNLNGVELGRVQDTLYPEGQVGIFFDAFSEGSFTNLTITRVK